ncbi:MFS transporter [Paraburkholderia sp. ZP32-5]|uniref:MFS transporter n=1 Tax=Paraburkholderia sp. ZP32-5 TaxID=2883245 RepID=UPI001F3FDD93|nr:MFS transporter [Paraburkholderia sp. ZP32-5]
MNRPHQAATQSIHDVFNSVPFGACQWAVFILCFLVTAIEGFDTTIVGFIAPAISAEWSLPRVALAPLVGTGLAGILLGSVGGGMLADRFGRKWVGAAAIAWFSVTTLASSVATSVSQLVLWRFVTGIGVGAAMPVMSALVAEYCSDKARSAMLAATFCGFLLGATAAGFATAALIGAVGWRGMLALSGALPLVVLVVFVWRVPESPRHMLVRAQPREAIQRAMTRIFPRIDLSRVGYGGEVPSTVDGKRVGLLSRDFRLGTLLTWSAEFCGYLVFFLVGSWLPSHMRLQGLSMVAASQLSSMFQFGALGGAVLFAWAVRRFNVATVVACAFGCGVVTMMALGGLESQSWYAGVVFLAGLTVGGPLICINTIAGIFYPTSLRASGGGWTLAMGRLGSIVGSALIGVIVSSSASFSAVCMLLSVPLLLACAAMARMRGELNRSADNVGSCQMDSAPSRSLTGAESHH